MDNDNGKSSTAIVLILVVAAFIGLVVWKFSALREYAYGTLSSEAVVPMPQYYVSDAAKIVEAAGKDRADFNQRYVRQMLSGEAVFAGSEGRGASTTVIKATVPGAGAITISCGMNKFAFAANKDALAAIKSGDAVHIRGPIAPDTSAQAIVLGDGCTVEKSYSQPAAR